VLLIDDDCSVKDHVRSPNALDTGWKVEGLSLGEGSANWARHDRNASGRRKKDSPVRVAQWLWRIYFDAWREWPVPQALVRDGNGFEGDGIANDCL
jgi:hypothetical protein